ncbi:hypothetical protein NC651_039885 [Populus alba x Populus x berolinensis]|nr:hypothetical protein NC651_039885 [Populus alba x Populus x berolinensis]
MSRRRRFVIRGCGKGELRNECQEHRVGSDICGERWKDYQVFLINRFNVLRLAVFGSTVFCCLITKHKRLFLGQKSCIGVVARHLEFPLARKGQDSRQLKLLPSIENQFT